MNKIISFLLVIFPLLNVYCLPGLTTWPISYVICVLLFGISLLRGGKLSYTLPIGFKDYWIYISITYILLAHSFGLGLFFPGGFAFFMWVLLYWLCDNFLDYNAFKKYYRIVFVVCAAVFLFQEFCYYTIGDRPLFMLPLPLYGVDRAEILTNQLLLDRSSCFFIEPSHFAQFTLPLLAIEVFDNSKGKVVNFFSIFIISVLLLLRSGNGIVGIIIILGIRLFTYLKHSNGSYKYPTYLVFIIAVVFCAYLYVSTEIGGGILERASGVGFSEDAESSTRIVKGFLLYSELPTVNKIFGYHIDDIENFAISSKLSYLFVNKKTGDYGVYLNGFQHVLVINGLLGVILFYRIFVFLFIRNNLLSKTLVIMFVILSFISNLYIGQMMLICLLFSSKFKRKKYEST